MEINIKKLCIASLIASSFLFVLALLYIWGFTVDDAFISFRYAEHLVSGLGLVWNINQPPVEGYTNFLWILIISFLLYVKLDPVILTKIIGLLSVSGIVTLFWFIINDIMQDSKNKFIAFSISTIILLLNPYTTIHVVSGLETMFYTFLLLAVVYSAWKITISLSSNFIWLFAFSALLLSLTRPEGIITSLALIFSIIYISHEKKSIPTNLTSFAPIIILYFIPMSIYTIFRVSYFHELFPLPFLVKVINGHKYPIDFISALVYLTPFILIILFTLGLKNRKNEFLDHKEMKYFKYFLLILGISFFFTIVPYISTPIMNFGQRFFYPAFVLLYAAFGIAIGILLNKIKQNKLNIKFAKSMRIISASAIIFVLFSTNFYGITDLEIQHDSGIIQHKSYIPIGESLSHFSDDNYTVAFADAGAVAYYSKWNFLDLVGLNDKYIADYGVTDEYLKQKSPELFIFSSLNGEIVVPGTSYNYVIENNYTRLNPIKNSEGYYFVPFLKPDVKDYQSIKDSLERASRESYQ